MTRESKAPTPQMWERLAEFNKRAGALQQRLAELEHVEVDRNDGGLAIAVDAHGKLLDLKISDELHHKVSATQLSERILDLYDQANVAMEDNIKAETEDVYGMPFTPSQVDRGEVTVPELMEQVKRQHGGS